MEVMGTTAGSGKWVFDSRTHSRRWIADPLPTNNLFPEKIFVISLLKSNDTRYEPLLARAQEKGVTFPIERIPAVVGASLKLTPEDNPVPFPVNTMACTYSHIKAIEKAKKDGLPCVLVLEDDVEFCEKFTYKLIDKMQWLPKDWDAVWLCGSAQPGDDPMGATWNKIKGSWGTYAYIVRNTMYDKFIRTLQEKKLPSDGALRTIMSKINCYKSREKIVFHIGEYSDRLEDFRSSPTTSPSRKP